MSMPPFKNPIGMLILFGCIGTAILDIFSQVDPTTFRSIDLFAWVGIAFGITIVGFIIGMLYIQNIAKTTNHPTS